MNGKRIGRRTTLGAAMTVLVTVAYYVCMFQGMDLAWFAEYSKTMLYIGGFVWGTLTITDSIQSWKGGR